MNIRPARVGDVPTICELIRTFADRKLMIRRSLGEIYESIREFLVATDGTGRIIGCAALHVFWEDLAELKCLAVSESAQGMGVGRALVDACWTAADELEIASVFTLTYVPEFFEKCGYHRVDKAELPHKIWNECVRCPLFPSCHEVALIRSREVGSPLHFRRHDMSVLQLQPLSLPPRHDESQELLLMSSGASAVPGSVD